MNKNFNCPLCHKDIVVVEEIETKELTRIYKNTYKKDFNYIWNSEKYIKYCHCSNCDLKFFHPAITGDDEFYRVLQNDDWYYLHEDKSEYTFSQQFISDKDKVLDIGAGRGVFSKYTNCNYYQGLDFSSKAIELANNDGVNVKPIPVEDHCQEKPEFYDVVVAFQLIEHISNADSFIDATVKCLKPGGYLIIATPDNDGFIKNVSNSCLNLPPHHVLHWNEESLSHIAKIFNLEVECVYREPLSSIHKVWWYNTDTSSSICKLFNKKIRMIDNSLSFRIIRGFSRIISKLIIPFGKHKKEYGQTIIMVYRKK